MRSWSAMGASTVAVLGAVAEAEKLRLSMPRPWALPVESAIVQTSHSAAPGGQFVIHWLATTRLVWLRAWVPSTAAPPTAVATVGKSTLRLGRRAVGPAGNV